MFHTSRFLTGVCFEIGCSLSGSVLASRPSPSPRQAAVTSLTVHLYITENKYVKCSQRPEGCLKLCDPSLTKNDEGHLRSEWKNSLNPKKIGTLKNKLSEI